MPVSMDVLALVLAALSLVLSVVALRRSAPRQGASASAAPPAAAPLARTREPEPRKAHVRVAVVGVGRSHRVVVSNVGPGAARHVTLSLEPRGEARQSPLVQADCIEKLPIAELPAGASVSMLATVSSGTGSEFDLRALWINDDGSREALSGVLVAP